MTGKPQEAAITQPSDSAPQGTFGAGDDFPTLPRRDVILTMAGVMLALFLSSLDQTIVATALPNIVLDLGGFDRLTWITTSYLVASTTVVPIAGRLSDMYGRKWFFVAGIVIFLVGSIFAGLSQSMTQLIAFRAIQGIGGGVMMANAFTTVADLFPPAERGKYMGFMTGVFGVSAILGPLLGGVLTDNLSWHWIFYVNVPISIPVLFLFVKYFPQGAIQRREHKIDYLGVLLLIAGVVPLLIGLAWANVQYPWGSWQVLGALAFGVGMLTALVLWEMKAEEPIIPLQMFKDRIVAVSSFIIFLTGFAMFGAIIFIPLYFQAVLGASASASGTFMTPMMLGMVVGATVSGQALSRLGGHYRRQGLLGLAVMIAGAALFTQIDVETSRLAATGMIVLFGFGMGTTFPLYTIAIQNTVPRHMMGIATSSTQFFRSIGGTIGLAIFGSFMVSRYTDGLDKTFTGEAAQAYRDGLLTSVTENPQALINPRALQELETTLTTSIEGGGNLVGEVVSGLQSSLASAIGDVFVIVVVLLVISWIATTQLKVIPLRARGGPPGAGKPSGEHAPSQPGDGDAG
ncbi:MAG: MFS transporter [Chloroflexi bacterium]|nr:MFS transporter [Chloroflexota bacterium]